MNHAAPVHLGLERILRIARLLIRIGRGLRTAFAIEQAPPAERDAALREPALRT